MSSPEGLQFEFKSGRLTVHATGHAQFERRIEFAHLIAETARQQPITALLVDLRDTAGPKTFMERYQLGELAAAYLPKVPIAVLMREEQTDTQLIGQLVARNRGLELEVFFEANAADRWLENRNLKRD